jgi:3-demethoxyubiquinol 3-hydroxylase
MSESARIFKRHLRVIHACEKGATGVYWGHRLVAWLFFRDLIPPLSQMHVHEMEHYAIFGAILKTRQIRAVSFPALWCAGGIVYGFLTALGGRTAVWKSTAVIEGIVERELLEAAKFFETRDPEIYAAIHAILLEELQHKGQGEANSQDAGKVGAVVGSAARASAAASKKLAERL